MHSSLWTTQAVPVSFTLTAGTVVEELLYKALGLFLHCTRARDRGEGKDPCLGSTPSLCTVPSGPGPASSPLLPGESC